MISVITKGVVSKRHRLFCCMSCGTSIFSPLPFDVQLIVQLFSPEMLDAKLDDDIWAKSSHSASICFRRVQMKCSITKPYFFTLEKSMILPVALCETSYVLFHTPKKYDFARRSVRGLISYFFTPQKSTILPVALCETSYRTFSYPKKVRFYPSLRAFSMTFNSVALPVQI